MKKKIGLLGLAFAGLVVLLLPLNADAACGDGVTYGSYYVNITNTSNTGSLRSNFWAVGGGNPTTGTGHDNGTLAETGGWLLLYGTGFKVVPNATTWATPGVDGCIDTAQGDTNLQRMAFSFSDVDGDGDMTYAAICVDRDTLAGTQFEFPNAGDIALVKAPAAAITGTVRGNGVNGAGVNEALITVGVPDFSAGYHTDGSVGCEQSVVIPQFDVYRQSGARPFAPGAGRDAGPWVLVATCDTDGSPACTFATTGSASNTDNFLAVAPRYNSNFSTGDAAQAQVARVGKNSKLVQTGPVLAITPTPKNIKNPKKAQ